MRHAPRKRFGQHFLIDPAVLSAIVEAVAPRPGDRVVEIGPGLGALTGALLERVPALDAVEIDRDLAGRLRRRWPQSRLRVHEADALDFDFAALAGDGRLRLVGNLPYNVSSPLLVRLLAFLPVIADQHFMLQKEVVDRIVADPGGADYGRLGVLLQAHCGVERLFDVPPAAFDPPPRVDSSVVRLVPHGRGCATRPRSSGCWRRGSASAARCCAARCCRGCARRGSTARRRHSRWCPPPDPSRCRSRSGPGWPTRSCSRARHTAPIASPSFSEVSGEPEFMQRRAALVPRPRLHPS